MTPALAIRLGVPYLGGQLGREAVASSAPLLLSAGSLWRASRGGWQTIPLQVWQADVALDSAGFTAMLLGGYRWTVAEFADFVVTNGGDGAMPFPWRWWSAMDWCCEPEIAGDRGEVERRIAATVSAYGELLEELQSWRREGVGDVPDPLPILQGRTPEDYLACARALARVIDQVHACRCPAGDSNCPSEWHRAHLGLPELVGLGSVCRRHLHGQDGLLQVLQALDAGLPRHVRLHLFGVKGQALDHLGPWRHRVASVDSMAWDAASRREDADRSTAARGRRMRSWLEVQERRWSAATCQGDLFARRAS